MSLLWHRRKARLSTLLKSHGDEDADGIALDRLMHGQSVIGKTAKTVEVDGLRFQDKDLDVVGTLDYGQFGVIDVVTCHLNNGVYVRKSVEKKFAWRTREQCSPQFERDILLQAVKTKSRWAPHLFCAFQTPTHLNLVMDYAERGTLWDVLESSPHDGRILESDLKWWIPQIVSAIHWCHSQGFAHRDIKPHNFVLTTDAHILLIDFGSAAPLLPPNPDGSQLLSRQYCLVPCGTCDYISPEILRAHEEALVALEMDDDDVPQKATAKDPEGYGVETDWWSLGAMLYEMAYGVAPFFANDIRSTYLKIMSHERSLRFDQKLPLSHEYQHFLRRLLTHAKQRLGRRNIMEITDHPLFDGVNWITLADQPAPAELHLPQFTYSDPKPSTTTTNNHERHLSENGSVSQGFAFSAFFQSSCASPGISTGRPSPGSHLRSSIKDDASSFIGFSWGPSLESCPLVEGETRDNASPPRPLLPMPTHQTPLPLPTLSVPESFATPRPLFSTPNRPYALSPYATLPRTGTVRRTAPRRNVSDREAMKQMVDCIGMSARKKVLESGRKPRILTSFSLGRASGTLRKELRFLPNATPIPLPDYSAANSSTRSKKAPDGAILQDDHEHFTSGSEGSECGPPSPSPSPRPGSAMSMMSRRSGTPTISMTATFSQRLTSISNSSGLVTGSATGFLSIPSSTPSLPNFKLSAPPAAGPKTDDDEGESEHDSADDYDSYDDGGHGSDSHEVEFQSRTPLKYKSNTVFRRHSEPPCSIQEMERRHRRMMRDIEELESRFDEVSMMM